MENIMDEFNGFLAINVRKELVRVDNYVSERVIYYTILTGELKGLTDAATLSELTIIPFSKNTNVY